MIASAPARAIVIGFRRWRSWNMAPMLRACAGTVVFVRDVAAARALRPAVQDWLVVWGATAPAGLDALAQDSGAALVRVEDGFIRSVGLGSDLIPPRSLVFDPLGIFFDATRPSLLEQVLATLPADPALRARAAALRAQIVAKGLTKYNIESHVPPGWNTGGRRVVLVPGQVESDASIALGAGHIRTNHALLLAARAARPDCFLVYKPHPDVMAGNRRGRLRAEAGVADHVETRASIVACLGCSDEVHTMTSQAGFDALLRGLPVTTYGMPFYAGWGLTDDRADALAPRARRATARAAALTLDDLVAGSLLIYPRYWDPDAGVLVTPEAAVAAIASERARLAASRAPDRLLRGAWRRSLRKIRVLARAWLFPA